MSNIIIWKLQEDPDTYSDWYDFLNWMNHATVREIGSWDDSYYTRTIYKSYEVFDDQVLTYILLKWNVINKGDADVWKQERRKVEYSIYDEQDLIWMEKHD